MDSQTYGPLFQRALKEFSPDVFHHPVWVRFADSLASLTDEQIQRLAQATNQVRLQGDWSSACQLLILCAFQQSRLGDYQGALANLQGAERLAAQYHLNRMSIWAMWGACALCAQQGKFRLAVEHLRQLQGELETSGDWILSDLVQLIHQSMSRLAEPGNRPAPVSRPVPTDPLLQSALEGLLHWGQVQGKPEPENATYEADRFSDPGASGAGSEKRVLRKWRTLLQNAWRLLRGDVQVIWVDKGKPSLPPPVAAPLAPPEPITVDNRTIPEEPSPPLMPSPSQQFIESGRNMLFFKPPNGANKDKASPLELPRAPLLLPAALPRKPGLVIYFFGSFKVYQQDQMVGEWLSQKGLSILKYLAAHHAKPVAKDILMDLFWSDAECEVARRNLHQAIYALRQTLRREQPGIQYIQFEKDCYFLEPELEIWLDFREFENQVQAGWSLERAGKTAEAMAVFGIAEALYQGDFLEEDLYEDWPRSQRIYYRTMYLNLLERLTEYYVQRREFPPALGLCQKVLARDNCNEQAYRWMIQCYLEQGQRQLAMREYQNCVYTLKTELNLAPSDETRAMYRQIVG